MRKPLGSKWLKAVSVSPKAGTFLHKPTFKSPPKEVQVTVIKRRTA